MHNFAIKFLYQPHGPSRFTAFNTREEAIELLEVQGYERDESTVREDPNYTQWRKPYFKAFGGAIQLCSVAIVTPAGLDIEPPFHVSVSSPSF